MGSQEEQNNVGEEDSKATTDAAKFNTYATKKTLAQGLLDISLLMANASQLKAVVDVGPTQGYFYVNVVLITISIILQVVAGIMMIILAGGKKIKNEVHHSTNRLNNITVGFVFAITVVNAFIASFGMKLQ